MILQAICIDMDGVIIDSEPQHFAAFAHALADIGFEITALDYETYFSSKTDARGYQEFFAAQDVTYNSRLC